MLRITSIVLLSLLLNCAWAKNTLDKAAVQKDIFFAESLYYAFQGKHFDAISKLDAELDQFYALDNPELDPFNQQINNVEFSVGSFELAYRMHQRAGRAIKAILESSLSQKIRNEAAYRLAKIYYEKNQPINALHILQKIQGDMPQDLYQDEIYLRAQVLILSADFAQAIALLKTIKNQPKYRGFALYNLGIAYIQNGQKSKGLAALDQLGQMNSDDQVILALKDKVNLMLANRLMSDKSPQLAKPYFNRVRLNGPFAERALLGAGWVNLSMGQYKRALVPWRILQQREVTNEAVQESMLALPYAYGQLHFYGQAALSYGAAMTRFASEIDRLQAAIKSVRKGHFLNAILQKQATGDSHWLDDLGQLPTSAETRYLMTLMASHDFQQSLLNYQDLAQLRARLNYWLASLDVYLEMIEIRRAYYQPLLPALEKQFKKLDAKIRLRLAQRDRLNNRLKSMVIARRPDYLANIHERHVLDKLNKMKLYLDNHVDKNTAEIAQRMARLEGVVYWNINTAYDDRLTSAYTQMQQLDVYINKLNQAYESFVRTRQAATQSYQGYDLTIRQLKTRIKESQYKVKSIMARQGRLMENMAINEFQRRRNQLEDYQIKARFALAESYDRATKKQQKAQDEALVKKFEEDKNKVQRSAKVPK